MLVFLNLDFFYFFFFMLLGIFFIITSILIILTESSVHSILYLMFLFLYLTELTILFKMEFLALIFLIVYIGAVCVLMLFHIKLIKTFIHRYDKINHKQLFLPFLIIGIFLPIIQILTLSFEQINNNLRKNLFMSIKKFKINCNNNYTVWVDFYENFNLKSTQVLGFLIYNIYFIPLIIGSFILLVAMIGSIFLTLLRKNIKKFQKIGRQVFTERDLTVFFYKGNHIYPVKTKKRRLKLWLR